MNVGDNITIETPAGKIYAIVADYEFPWFAFVTDTVLWYEFNFIDDDLEISVIKENDYILKRNSHKKYVPLPIINQEVIAFWKGHVEKGEKPIYVEIPNRYYEKLHNR